MTAICGGGTSSAQPGFASTMYIGPAAIGALLNNIPTPWAVGFAALIGGLTYELSTFCTTDPPAIPTFTAGDYLALIAPFPVPGQQAAILKLEDLIGAYLWPQLCKCDSVATPPAGPAPDPPPGVVPVAPPVGVPNGTPCSTMTVTKTTDWIAGSNLYRVFPTPIVEQSSVTSAVLNERILLPGDAASITATTQFASGAGTSLKLISTLATWPSDDPGASAASVVSWDTLPGETQSRTLAVPSGAVSWSLRVQKSISGGTAVSNDGTFTANVYCGVPGGVTTIPCCPPDPQVTEALSRIFELLTITQRQVAPFSYVYGTNHTGLTGSGTLSVSSLIGCSVDVTTLPDSYGRDFGNPDLLYDLGRITLGTADGFESSRRLDHDGTLILPTAAGVFTSIAYSLAPGVVVAIRELVREP